MLLKNVHHGLVLPQQCSKSALVEGDYFYYHYGVDVVTDQGWGCGYRTLQTIASWLMLNRKTNNVQHVPSLSYIQQILVEVGDKEKTFIGSTTWIGSFEIFLVLDHLFQVPCKLLHVNGGDELHTLTTQLFEHFTTKSPPIMMGGDVDAASKAMLGIASDNNGDDIHLLVVDPHFSRSNDEEYSKEKLQLDHFVRWQPLSSFDTNSFYNLCVPIIN